MMEAEVVYDKIGTTYDNTRMADSLIAGRLIELMRVELTGKYLDVGCGSGNYTIGLAQRGAEMEGIDISDIMLEQARDKFEDITFHLGDARHMPLPDHHYDGACSVLATHHIDDLSQAFSEVYRVMNKGSFVIFTSTPEQMRHYWLSEYFPEMMIQAAKQMTSFPQLKTTLETAGFTNVIQTPFFIAGDMQDRFLQAGKYRPEIYLDPQIRAGNSEFQLSTNKDELAVGLQRLAADIDSGQIKQIIENYECDRGDYSFITAIKPCKKDLGITQLDHVVM